MENQNQQRNHVKIIVENVNEVVATATIIQQILPPKVAQINDKNIQNQAQNPIKRAQSHSKSKSKSSTSRLKSKSKNKTKASPNCPAEIDDLHQLIVTTGEKKKVINKLKKLFGDRFKIEGVYDGNGVINNNNKSTTIDCHQRTTTTTFCS